MKKFFAMLAAIAVSVLASAQSNEVYKDDYTPFTNIEASKFVEVTLCYSQTYATKVSADKLIADYVQVYVKGSTLYLTVDEKSYAPEVKKALKGKNAIIPSFRVTVYTPSINSIKLSDNAQLYTDEAIKADVIKVVAENNSVIRSLKFDSQDASIKLSNKAQARLDIYTNSISIDISNSVGATFVLNCSNLAIGAAGSSNVSVSAEARTTSVKSQGSAIVTITGSTGKVNVEGSNTSRVYADGFVASDADILLSNNSLCEINAKEHLKVDLSGSSHLIYNANPAIDVTRIVSSTMTKSSDTTYRKR